MAGEYPMEEAMFQIAESVWSEVLGLQVQPAPGGGGPSDATDTTGGCIEISGAWHGAVSLHCPVELARTAAAIMFSLAPEAATASDVEDALGELVNQIGGNLKALLPGPCQLSLPVVGANAAAWVAGARLVHRIVLECEGQSLVVALLERGDA
ncbi:MAG: chemotaxis protein CheX [Candidatus Binatia bacterium]